MPKLLPESHPKVGLYLFTSVGTNISGKKFIILNDLCEYLLFLPLVSRQLKITICTACISLLLLVSLRYVIFTTCVATQKNSFRIEALVNAQGDEVCVMNIPLKHLYTDGNGLEWKDKNKELVIEGKFYEVISISKHTTTARIVLVADKEETELFDEFFEVKHKDDGNFYSLLSLLAEMNFTHAQSILFLCQRNYIELSIPFGEINFPEGFKSKAERPPCLG